MKRILTLWAVLATAIVMMSCDKEKECKCVCDCNNESDTDEIEVINSSMKYGYLENWGIYYDDQPSDVNNWVVYLSVNDFDEEGWSDTGDLIMIELFSTSADAPAAGKYTVEAFIADNYCNFSVGDGYEDEDEYCAGTWLFQDGYGVAAALSGECNVKVSGDTYTITYDFSDDEYGIQFKGKYTGKLDVYDQTEGASYAAVKSPAPAKTKRPVSAARF